MNITNAIFELFAWFSYFLKHIYLSERWIDLPIEQGLCPSTVGDDWDQLIIIQSCLFYYNSLQ